MDVKHLIQLGLEEAKATEIYNNIQNYTLEQVKNKTKEYEEKISLLNLNLIIERYLFKAGAKNIKATKALIDFDKLNKKNIDEQLIKQMIDELKNNEETRFLFFDDDFIKLKGFKPLETNFNKMAVNKNLSYEELCKHYEKGIF